MFVHKYETRGEIMYGRPQINNDQDDCSSYPWRKRLPTSPFVQGTAAYTASHHSSTSMHCTSPGWLLIWPSWHADASIFYPTHRRQYQAWYSRDLLHVHQPSPVSGVTSPQLLLSDLQSLSSSCHVCTPF